MPTTIKATPIIARELKCGDLFSIAGPEYWDLFPRLGSIGEQAYIRTDAPPDADDARMTLYKLDIIKD